MELKKDEILQTVEQATELAKETLEQVTGGGNPFDKVPRVPVNPIDDELRENG